NDETPAPSPNDAWSTLEELINKMAFDKCNYRPEVINALFRRAPLSIPATGFGFRGPGISYSTQSSTPLPGFRHNDSVTILQAGQTTSHEPFFEHNDGRERDADEKLTVLLQPGEWVTFDIETPHPGAWTIVVVTDPDATAPPIVGIDGTQLAVDDLGNGQWQAITDPDIADGRHTIRVGASTGILQLDRVNVQSDPS
ncbi:hypothetical protein MNBD_ACTINO02-1566, partial [hydrothermal vent metagenome]